jgi:RNA polymerase sigma factor (sigma-70 family)
MTDGDRLPVTRHLRRLLDTAGAGGLSDPELLQRFIASRDAAAFEVLVWRHGPLVLGACRQVLRHEQDAEDAFQATFLVLVRKARSIGKGQAVGSWLYRVAYRVALRAKMLAAKKSARQTRLTDEVPGRPTPDPAWGDLRPVLDEEINHLPEKYRAPFVLCYLDGKTNEEAAHKLGCPKGTVLSRLAWARQRLRTQLTRRGLSLSAGLPVMAPATTLPAVLVDATLKAAFAGNTAISGPVAALTEGVLQTMLWTKLKIVVGCLLAVSTIALGGVLTWQALEAGPQTGQAANAPEALPAEPEKADKPPEKKEASVDKTFDFELRDKPWMAVIEWYSDISGLAFAGSSKPTGTATFIPAKGKRKYTLGEITDLLNEMLLAQKYILIRRDATFTLLPADEKIDPIFVPRVRLDDLGKRGKTELVSVVRPVTAPGAKDLGPDVKKMLGPFGEIVVMEKANVLILQDTAGNLRQINDTLKAIEADYAERIRESRKITEAETQKWLDAQKKRNGDKP